MEHLSILFLIFIIFSILGYIIEVISVLINYKRFIYQRGYLVGPIIPLYGIGCIGMILLFSRYNNDVMALFAVSMLFGGALEYFTSYIMEKIFKIRWWDYSKKKFNINGRITINSIILFGIGGVLVVKYIYPLLYNTISSIPLNIIYIITIVLIIALIVDIIISTISAFKLKENIDELTEKDNTLLHKEGSYKILIEKINGYKRILKSFPNIEKTVDRLKRRRK